MAARYTLLGERLAKGGYGEVWRAWDEEEERLVAVKKQPQKSEDASREMDALLAGPAHRAKMGWCANRGGAKKCE